MEVRSHICKVDELVAALNRRHPDLKCQGHRSKVLSPLCSLSLLSFFSLSAVSLLFFFCFSSLSLLSLFCLFSLSSLSLLSLSLLSVCPVVSTTQLTPYYPEQGYGCCLPWRRGEIRPALRQRQRVSTVAVLLQLPYNVIAVLLQTPMPTMPKSSAAVLHCLHNNVKYVVLYMPTTPSNNTLILLPPHAIL